MSLLCLAINIRESILIIIGTNVTEKLGNHTRFSSN